MSELSLIQRGSTRLPRFTLLMALTAIGLFLGYGPAPELLVYDREAIIHGELWRLLTGHLVHSDTEHAFWDILALVLIGTLLERRGLSRIVKATGAGLITVNAWLMWGLPELTYYCGLSGVLHTLLAVLLIELWREQKNVNRPECGFPAGKGGNPTAIAVMLTGIGILGKILVEIQLGQALFTDTAWPSIPSVHLAGVIGSVLYTGLWHIQPQLKTRCKYPLNW